MCSPDPPEFDEGPANGLLCLVIFLAFILTIIFAVSHCSGGL